MDIKEQIRKLEIKLNSLSFEDKKEFIKNKEKRIIYHAEWLNSLDDVQTVLDDVYPELWDYQFSVHYYNDINQFRITPYVLLHFPLINITNGKLKHVIKDIFIKLSPTYDKNEHIVFTSLDGGFRMTHTPSEINSGYSFSHMSGDANTSYISIRSLCTGSGEINQTLAMQSTWNPNLFKLLLLQIKTYLEWESLAGVPYNHLRNIIPRNVVSSPRVGNLNAHYLQMRSFYKNNNIPDINFKIENGYIRVVTDAKFENFIKIYGDKEEEYYTSDILAYKDVQGNYYDRSSIVAFNPRGGLLERFNRILHFRGKEIPYKIENAPEEERVDANQPVYIKPQLINYVKSRIEYQINKGKVRDSIIGKLNTP